MRYDFVPVIVLLMGIQAPFAGPCSSENAEARYLPRVIGRPHSTLRTPYPMPCDTMEVRIGDTCTIHPGVMFHFGPDSKAENVVFVRGTLQVFGSEESPVYFSGTLAEGEFGYKPGSGAWGGFRIDPVGQADFKNVRIFKAVPALESHSEKVTFEKTVFKGCLTLKGPGGKEFALDYKETRIDVLDFRPHLLGSQDEKEAPTRGTRNTDSTSSSKLKWGLISGGILAAGGGLFLFLNPQDGGGGNPGPDLSKFPVKPSFPTSPDPR